MTQKLPASIGTGIGTVPEQLPPVARGGGDADVRVASLVTTSEAAQVLVEHLFAQTDAHIPGVSYAVTYKLAAGQAGGDIVDVYHFDNDSVAFSIADIEGKGTQAAVHAALIKYGLRAYCSQGLTPERVLRSMDRLYLENNTFEGVESFATVFFAVIDPSRRLMTYASGGHEPAIVIYPDGSSKVLEPTAPIIGVFDDLHHLFKQRHIELQAGTLFVSATDGVTEARNPGGELFGMGRLIECAVEYRHENEKTIVEKLLERTEVYCEGRRHDDIAILAARFP
ncbi:MAG: serine/threonine-protein phosphatase [Candidatus Eremiobacteraeota bacterium]|nr:serine/threonine-protein phosphatase [Candidatus Eremiobacteraeota bacterium]